MESSIIERINKIINYKKMSPRAFSKIIDFNYSTLNSYLSGRRSSIDYTLIEKIIFTFDDISSDWILTGRGNMLKEEEIKEEKTIPNSIEKSEIDNPTVKYFMNVIEKLVAQGEKNAIANERNSIANEENARTISNMFSVLEKIINNNENKSKLG